MNIKNQILPILALSIFTPGSSKSQNIKNMAQKPNVIYVFADQWRAQATGFNGDNNAMTPVLDKLATESVVFSTAVSIMPVCCPYRASMLTGQYPLTNGVFMNDVLLDPEANTMGKIYKNAGYNTAYIGKWHLDGQYRLDNTPPERRQGFDYWKAMNCTHDYNNSKYFANDDTIASYWPGYDAYYQTLDATNYISDHASDDEPFLLVLSWGPPHDPYQAAPQEYRDKYSNREIQLRPNVLDNNRDRAVSDLRNYYSHINALDDCLSLLLETLEETNIADNTILVFTSDHGDMLYSHGLRKKQQPYDESILVPFILRYPEMLGNEQKLIDAPINTTDILPTLLGLCGINIPSSVEGSNLSKYMYGNNTELPDTVALIECIQPFGEWPRGRGGKEYRGIRTVRYTYVRDLSGPWLLFDNVTDPYQMNNLVDQAEFSDLQVRLDGLLMQKLEEQNDEFLPGLEYVKMYNYPPLNASETVPYYN